MFIDTHAHVNFRAFKDDAEMVLRRAVNAGVGVINVGSQIDTSKQAVELAEKFQVNSKSKILNNKFNAGVYAVVGLHPIHLYSQRVDEEETHFQTREENFNYDVYLELARRPTTVGIGECGLDYYRLPQDNVEEIKHRQQEAFRAQIKLARELNKTLVIHSRSSKDTDDACLDILEILNAELKNDSYQLRIVLHSYTGGPEILAEFIKLGVFVSFNGIITFDKTGNMEKLVKQTSIDKILLETDCPYLSPEPMRGKRNEPLYVRYVAEKIARIKNLSVCEVGDITTVNAKKVFKLISPRKESQ